MTNIHQNKIELDKKHLNKQMVQSLQVLRIFQVRDGKHSNKHMLVLRRAKHQTSFFSHDKGC